MRRRRRVAFSGTCRGRPRAEHHDAVRSRRRVRPVQPGLRARESGLRDARLADRRSGVPAHRRPHGRARARSSSPRCAATTSSRPSTSRSTNRSSSLDTRARWTRPPRTTATGRTRALTWGAVKRAALCFAAFAVVCCGGEAKPPAGGSRAAVRPAAGRRRAGHARVAARADGAAGLLGDLVSAVSARDPRAERRLAGARRARARAFSPSRSTASRSKRWPSGSGEKGVKYPVALADTELATAYGADAFPFHVVLGPDGKVLERLESGFHDRGPAAGRARPTRGASSSRPRAGRSIRSAKAPSGPGPSDDESRRHRAALHEGADHRGPRRPRARAVRGAQRKRAGARGRRARLRICSGPATCSARRPQSWDARRRCAPKRKATPACSRSTSRC